MRNGLITLFLGGDVMTGRGVDQILPHPGDPRLWERYARDARGYVDLAAAAGGHIPTPVDFSWPWGDALAVLAEQAPDVRVINLETSITASNDVVGDKPVRYRMSPDNLACLTVAHPDVCALANNHILDFGRRGLDDTVRQLAGARIATAGAGHDLGEAGRPAIVRGGDGRVIVGSLGLASSGIPADWAATTHRAGVNYLAEVSAAGADALAESMTATARPGDITVASIHWGSNWGYSVPAGQVDFAHRLIDAGVDLVHGHSSHHVRPIEVYRGRLILYGCGDLIDDYEGIGGHGEFRDDLRLLYLATVRRGTGALTRLRMAVLCPRRMRLRHAARADVHELRTVLDEISQPFGSRFSHCADGMLSLRMRRRWPEP